MKAKVICSFGVVAVLVLAGCSTVSHSSVKRAEGDSFVFAGPKPAKLAYLPEPGCEPELRSTYLRSTESIIYKSGQDYVFDSAAGTIRRTATSRIPDFRTNMLYGLTNFDHSRFPGFGNNAFFAYADYCYRPPTPWPVQKKQTELLPRTKAKLKYGDAVKIVAFGDSITAGGEATMPQLIFWQRWADDLQRQHPKAKITAINGATGGDTTIQGLERLQSKVLDQKPDLVLIAFGMNDHNVSGVPIPQFKENLVQMISKIRSETGAEVILLSTFPPNPRWKFGSHHMQDYAAATEQVAAGTKCAYADIYNNWQSISARKKPEDLLGNNINHPNDFGHWIYFEVLRAIGL